MKRYPLHRCLAQLRLLLLAWVLASPAAAAQVWVIHIDGPIGPASADHMTRSLERAIAANAEAVVLRIDTPGGLDSAMRDMIKAVLAAPVPVLGYVGPSGARAASAGTYLLYATHIAAMAPGTNLGSATPVQLGGGGLPGLPGAGEEEQGAAPPPAAGSTAMERKVVNDAVAYIRSLAQLRGRNGDWAERAVRDGVSLPAEDALAAGVIDQLADSIPLLLQGVHGTAVDVGDASRVLDTAGAAIVDQAPDWRSEFLAVITNPNIAYILLLVGIYGLVIEFYNPGIGLPGIVGAVSLLIALYALQMLPVSYAGMGLLLLGVALMAAEAFAPSFGVLGLGGAAAFVTGSIMLMDTNLPAYQLALPIVLAVTVFSVGLLVFALGMVLRARKHAVVSGVQRLVGMTTQVARLHDGEAWVWLDGELWHARSEAPLQPDEPVVVLAIDGLTAVVRRQSEQSPEKGQA
ncbi:MAG: serine protease [Haliea sp.]|uniref:NfeD family protein n=1 Tax=Haliea sp. TaxID=1932666 RepID=UPI000C57DA49|nr:nodulation protein NfeD [Haliea sp.]MBM70000.1 serine protease [Haliea sp.]|tara:strand:- start:24925 stop:26307 length:1383 start_codon:yes stop_codon:yes gene_type:complete